MQRLEVPDAKCQTHRFITDYETGEVVCSKCGLVATTRSINPGAEWRAYNEQEAAARSRVGTPISFAVHDKGLPTVIDGADRDARGRHLHAARRFEMYKLRKTHKRTLLNSAMGRNLSKAMAILDRTVDKLHLPGSVKEKAAVIYRRALDADVLRGRSIEEIVTASLYAACRQMETPRSLKDIILASGVRRHDLARSYRLLIRELDLRMPVQDPRRCVAKIAAKAGIGMQTQLKAIVLLDEAKKKGITAGKHPMGLAAAALYLACTLGGERKSQEDIAMAASCTEVTVRYRYKGLKDSLGK